MDAAKPSQRNAITLAIVEGNVVVLEHRRSATLPNGRSHVKDYCFVYELKDEKVWRIGQAEGEEALTRATCGSCSRSADRAGAEPGCE